jgi:hypothetical protein
MTFIALARAKKGWRTVALATLVACTPASDGSPQKNRSPIAAWEQPQLFAAELRAAFKTLR